MRRARLLLTALLLAPGLALAGGPAPAAAQTAPEAAALHVTSLAEARRASLAAVSAGRIDLALALADAVLQVKPEDSFSHLVRATALLRDGQPQAAAPAARLAYRHADTARQKHESARIAALAAAQRDRFLLSQVWMRRAVQAAEDPATRARSIREFRQVSRAARTDLSFGLSVAPSNNVNNGASSRVVEIDGIAITGRLSDDALALPGTVMRASAGLKYRLHATERSLTRATAALAITRVRLDAEARTIAPGARDTDYADTWAEAGLEHSRILAPGLLLQAEAGLGRVWSAGARAHDLARAGLTLGYAVSGRDRLTLGTSWQGQLDFADGRADVGTGALSLGWSRALSGGDRLSLGLSLRAARSDNPQARQTGRALSLGYTRAEPLGPLTVSGRLTLAEAQYPDYAVALFAVPGGRQDTTLSAEVNFGVTPLEYMGFIPTVTLSGQRTRSNVSRFETEELSLSVGFRSSF